MNDGLEREIDELLAQLGFAESARRSQPRTAPRWAAWRRRLLGSPVRLMLLSLVLLVGSLLLHLALIRPALFASAGLFVIAYLTWLFEPDPADASWFGRFYRWLYGQN